MSTIGQRIKTLRVARRLSGAALARKIGIKQPSLWELENKPGAEPSGRVLAELCKALHTTGIYIMFGGQDGNAELESELAEMSHLFRSMSPESRIVIINAARSLAPESPLSGKFRSAKTTPPPAQKTR